MIGQSEFTDKLSAYSRSHRRVSWHLLQVLAGLPGVLLLTGFFVPAIMSIGALIIVIIGDPLLRHLLKHYELVRSIAISTFSVYSATALLYHFFSDLALPFLVISISI